MVRILDSVLGSRHLGGNMKALTTEELNRLLNSIADTRLRAMVLLGFRHGMRASEICGLRRQDVDLRAGRITVRRLKGSNTTVQPLGEDEKELLALILAKAPRSSYVFPSATGEAYNRRLLWKRFKAACLSVGISAEKSHPHALKHGLGRALVAANVNLAVVKRALGHRNISSTAVYTEMDDETTGQIVQAALQKGEHAD